MRPGSKIKWAIAGAVAGFAAVATAAFATGVVGGEQFQACAKIEGGQLRLVADAADCLPSERAVSWSASGGATAFQTVTETVSAQGGLPSATATCPAGTRVVGGGGHANPVQGGNVIATSPAGDAAWTVTAAVNPLAQTLTAYAICATT
jgi:hypothetical protein